MLDRTSVFGRTLPIFASLACAALLVRCPTPACAQSTSILTQTGSGATNLIAPTPLSNFVAGLDVSSATFKATGGTSSRTQAAAAADVVNIANYGAVADMTVLGSTAYTIAASSTSLASSAGLFNAAMVGKTIVLPGAGASGAGLVSVIQSYTDAQHVTLATAATTALSAVTESAELGTDNTTAINNAIAAVKARTAPVGTSLNFIGTLYVPDGAYLVQTLNFTGIVNNGFRVTGQGEFWGVNAGQPVVDMLDTRFMRWSGVNIRGDAYAMPSIGLQLGRIGSTSTNSSDNNAFDHFWISGDFTLGAMLNEQSEATHFSKVHFFNGNSAVSYGIIQDGYHHFAAASAYVTNAEPVDAPQSFDANEFDNCIVYGYYAAWIGGTAGHSFNASYFNSAGPYEVILYNESSGYNTHLTMDVHMETATGNGTMTDNFFVTGTGTTSVIMEGFTWRELGDTATNSMFKVDSTSGITAIRLSRADIDVFSFAGGATKLFDSASPWTVRGHIYVPAAADMNLTVGSGFVGRLEDPTSLTNYDTIPASVFSGGLSTAGITTVGVVGSVSITSGGTYYGSTASYVPTITFGAAPSGGTTAVGHVSALAFYGQGSLGAAGTGYTVANNVPVEDANGNTLFTVNITGIGTSGAISSMTVNTTTAALTAVPASPLSIVQSGGSGGTVTGYNMKITGVAIDTAGAGYTAAPTATFSSTHASPAAVGTANLLTAVTIGGAFTATSLQVGGQAKIGAWPVTTQSGTYTFASSDCGSRVAYAGTANVTWTVPAGLATGCVINVVQRSTGVVTLAAASGVTAEEYVSFGTKSYSTAGQYSQAQVLIDSASSFLLSGQVD